jgi:hypothetical protein
VKKPICNAWCRALVAVSLVSLGGRALAASSYERIKNGVGNVIVGEEVPYQNDAGFKNVVTGSVKLSDLSKWKTFYVRAFLLKKIDDIKHDVRVLVMHLTGVGGKAAAFEKQWGGATILLVRRANDPAGYGERSEWSRYWQFDEGIPLKYYTLAGYDPKSPKTFKLEMDEDVKGDLSFSPAQLRKWKAEYGLSRLDVATAVYAFNEVEKVTRGETGTKRVAKSDGKGGYVIKDEQTVSHLREVTIWDAGQFLAEGRFSIQLD